MKKNYRILALGGDGIGPEVVNCSLQLIRAVAEYEDLSIEVSEDLIHGRAWDSFGTFCRDETVQAALQSDAVLVGAVGGRKWEGIRVPGGPEMQDGLMRLRKELATFAGLRPIRAVPCLEALTPFRPGLVKNVDILIVREMCGGVMFGEPRGIDTAPDGSRTGYDNAIYSSSEIERVARAGFEMARRRERRLVSVDKANVMESGVLWRNVVTEVAAKYPDVTLSHMYADNASYQLGRDPGAFDVILTDNLFGDILSDQAGTIAGSLAMLPSACLRELPREGHAAFGIFEAVHGTAPDIAGKGIANPIGTLLSVAMIFELSFVRPDICRRIEAAVNAALEAGVRTPDLGGTATSASMTEAIIGAYWP